MTNSRPPRRPRGRSGSSKNATRPKLEELHPVEDVPDIKSFSEFALADDIQQVIADMGITEPTPIQQLAIGPVLEGRDVIAKAETGTGKTLAFGAPMMSRIEADRASVLGLVLCPTRELASQVWEVLVELGKPRGVSVALVVGGDPMHPQVKALREGAQVVVGTPGRVLDLANQRFLTFPWTEFAVLDEADEMLEIGFIDDVRKILDMCSEDRQTLLFSATFPPELLRLARDHTKNPVEVATAKGVASVENITHYVSHVGERDRDATLKRLIHSTADDDVLLVFCDRRVEVERVLRTLERTRLNVKALHGGYDQASRTRVMTAFRDGSVKVLVATDVASRGLDIKHVTHVINLSVPRSISAYTHRSGRTGRAGRTGAALTIVVPADERRWKEIEAQMTWEVIDFDKAQAAKTESPRRRESTRREPAESDSERPRRSRRTAEESSESEPRARRSSGRTSRSERSSEPAAEAEERPRRSTGRTSRSARSSEPAAEAEERPRRSTGRTSRSARSSEPAAEVEERPRRSTGRTSRSARSSEPAAETEERPRRSTGRTSRSERSSEPAAETEERPRRSTGRTRRTSEREQPAADAPPSAAAAYVRETRRTERDRRRQEAEERTRSSQPEPSAEAPRSRRSRSSASAQPARAESTEGDRESRPRRRRPARGDAEASSGAERAPAAESEAGAQRPRRESRSRRSSESAKPPAKKDSTKPTSSPKGKGSNRSGGGFGAGI